MTLQMEPDQPVPTPPASRPVLACTGSPCLHPNLCAYYHRHRNAKSPKARADNVRNEDDEPEPADARLPLQLPNGQDQIDCRRGAGGQCNTDPEADYSVTCPPAPNDRGEQNGMCPATPPQVAESRARRTPTPPDEESAADLEPVDAEPRLPPQSPCSAASGRRVDPQQGFGSCGLPQHRDHRDDNDQASCPDDGGEKNDEEGPTAPPQARESMAGLLALPDGGGNVDHEPAGASPPMQPPAGRDQASGRGCSTRPFRQRRRRRDADEEEGSVYSDSARLLARWPGNYARQCPSTTAQLDFCDYCSLREREVTGAVER